MRRHDIALLKRPDKFSWHHWATSGRVRDRFPPSALLPYPSVTRRNYELETSLLTRRWSLACSNEAKNWGFDLIKIAVSVSIFQGERDVIHQAGTANYLDAYVPRAKLTVVPGVGSLWTLTGLRPVLQD
jgi:hypothetical protein